MDSSQGQPLQRLDLCKKGNFGVERGQKTKGALRHNKPCKKWEDRVTNCEVPKALVQTLKSELPQPKKKRKLCTNQPKAHCEIHLGMGSSDDNNARSDDDNANHNDSDKKEQTLD